MAGYKGALEPWRGRPWRRYRAAVPGQRDQPARGSAGTAAAGHRDRSRFLPGRRRSAAAWRRVPPQWADDPRGADWASAARVELRLEQAAPRARDGGLTARRGRRDPRAYDHGC